MSRMVTLLVTDKGHAPRVLRGELSGPTGLSLETRMTKDDMPARPTFGAAMRPVDIEESRVVTQVSSSKGSIPARSSNAGLHRVFCCLHRTGPDDFPRRLGLECHRLFIEGVGALVLFRRKLFDNDKFRRPNRCGSDFGSDQRNSENFLRVLSGAKRTCCSIRNLRKKPCYTVCGIGLVDFFSRTPNQAT